MTAESTLRSKAGELCAECLEEQQQESSVTGLRRCHTAETHDWQPREKGEPGLHLSCRTCATLSSGAHVDFDLFIPAVRGATALSAVYVQITNGR